MCEDAPVTDVLAHFVATDDGFRPTQYAHSRWGDDHLNGPAIVGLAATELERRYGAPEFMPTRLTVDLFRAARARPTTVSSRLVRDGRRVRNAECEVIQDGAVVARAILVLYRRSEAPPGQLWSAPGDFVAPPGVEDATPGERFPPFTGSDELGWTRRLGDHQNASRTRFVDRAIDVVDGTANSPFVRAAMVAEHTSLTAHLGTHGVGYINGDLTLALARLPVSDWVGVQEDSHWAADGISVGSATVFDRRGPIGTGVVTAVANPAAQIDFDTPTLEP